MAVIVPQISSRRVGDGRVEPAGVLPDFEKRRLRRRSRGMSPKRHGKTGRCTWRRYSEGYGVGVVIERTCARPGRDQGMT